MFVLVPSTRVTELPRLLKMWKEGPLGLPFSHAKHSLFLVPLLNLFSCWFLFFWSIYVLSPPPHHCQWFSLIFPLAFKALCSLIL